MIKYLRLPLLFDVTKMKEEVVQLGDALWLQHYQKLHYEGGWTAVPLRSIEGRPDNVFVLPTDTCNYGDTDYLKLSPYLQQVLSHFQCPLLSVRLLNLKAGSIIKEHRDTDLCFEKGEMRLHIPIVTNGEIEFVLDGETMTLCEGECWYMNFDLPHRLHNKSNTDRIQLVIDAVVNDWVMQLFTSKEIHVRKEVEVKRALYNHTTTKEIISRLRELNIPVSHQLADDMEMELASNGPRV